MTIALSALLTGFEEFIEGIAVESTADAGSDATKIVDAALDIYPEGYFIDWWLYVIDGLALGDIRQVETFVKVSGTLTPWVNFSAAVASGDDYEIHKYNVDSVKRALNDAIISLFSAPPRPKLFRKIVFESLGQDDLAEDALAAQAVVEVTDDTLFFEGQEVTVTDDNASEDVTILSIAAATNKLTMTTNLVNAYTTVAHAKVVAKSGKYFNLGATIGDARVTGLFLKSDDASTRTRVTAFEIIESLVGERQIYFPGHTVSVDDQLFIIEAIGKLEVLTTPESTITIEARRVNLLYAEAAYHLYDKLGIQVFTGDADRMKEVATQYRRKVYDDYRGLWLPRIQEIADISTDGD